MSEDVFEITDFTTASDWERFVSDLEEVITRWQLSGKDLSSRAINAKQLSEGIWSKKEETIRFSKITFSLVFHKLEEKEIKELKEETKVENNEESVSCPQSCIDGQTIAMDWPSRCHCIVRYFGVRSFLVLSSEENIGNEDRIRLLMSSLIMALSSTKCFIPLFIEWNPIRRQYSGVCLNDCVRADFQTIVSQNFQKRFKHLSNILDLMRNQISNQSSIRVSIRLSFSLNKFPDHWIHEINEEKKNKLFIHSKAEPLKELQMSALFPDLAEDSIIDSENHSDLDPNSAEKWSLRALFNSDYSSLPLSDCLSLLSSLSDNYKQILDESLEEQEIKDAFIPLTSDQSKHKWIKDLIRDYVFCEEEEEEEEEKEERNEDLNLKSAPFGSLAWKTSVSLLNVLSKRHKLEDLRLFWRQFVHRLRENWEQSKSLPNCSSKPDFRFSLFCQKLQMIETCIREKPIKDNQKEESDDESEFFDAQSEPQPEGRLKITDLKRVSDSSQLIWIPETQESSPMTEDMINEQLALFQRLGTSSLGTSLRAKVQSASLLSDMEAFKAANIGSTFEDFIRWHSPRDCDSSGQLSSRFQTSNNLWKEVWNSAKSVSAKRQKRLFDFTTEAEKVLHFFESISFSDLSQLVTPIVIHSVIIQLREQRIELNLKENKIQNNFENIRNEELFLQRFQSILTKLRIASQLESNIDQKIINEFIEKLLTQREVQIQSFGLFADLLRKLFAESLLFEYHEKSVGERDNQISVEKTLPEPIAKEFILRALSRRPATYSREVPQRMYCLWTENEVRIATSFTEDSTYC